MNESERKIPRHIAIIMDGNGRWANRRGLPRVEGHKAGAETVERVIRCAIDQKVQQLTLYCLSSENWKRPQPELDALMLLLKTYLIAERPRLREQGIRLIVIGGRDRLPEEVRAEIKRSEELTRENQRLTLCLAINYGSRAEIVEAARKIARKAQSDPTFDVERVDEPYFASMLDTAGMSDPDLLIRTAGESRLSNYLLWQLSYAEIYVTDVCWPDFDAEQFQCALADYASRERKFGGLPEPKK